MGRKKKEVKFPLMNAHAAGIDIGSKENWVCAGSSTDKIRCFGVFTEDHHSMARWLKSEGVRTIAMESTGFYWMSLFLILQDYDFEVLLVNAGHIKNVRGKKTDAKDCQWIWQLHSAGLLRSSFLPDSFTEELRVYSRQRRGLIRGASSEVSKMHKSLVLMNLQLPVVLTDITGKSGQAIIKAILDGQRDGVQLAALADSRVRAPKETIAKALTGAWHKQHLFTLRQAWEKYEFLQKQIAECDKCIDELLSSRTDQQHQNDLVYEPLKKKVRSKNAPPFPVEKYVYQLTDGVDLMQIGGVAHSLLLTLVCEVGVDLETKFPSSKHFVSWLGLCPNKKVSGGKTLSSRTRKSRNLLAVAFRQTANSIGNQKETELSQFFRRLSHKKGRKFAITATARKLAIIIYNMIVKGEQFDPNRVKANKEKERLRKVNYLKKVMQQYDIQSEELVTC